MTLDTAEHDRTGVRFVTPSTTERGYAILDTPIGTLLIVAAGTAVTTIYLDESSWKSEIDPTWVHRPSALRPITAELAEYFTGGRAHFSLDVAPVGTPFQLAVWHALTTIPYGEVATYGEIARTIGRPGAGRAVGGANNANRIPILIPCHRVIGADGSLTGYASGVDRKRALLELERPFSRSIAG